MNIYLLETAANRLPKELGPVLEELGRAPEILCVSEDHSKIPACFKDKPEGLVFFPAVWTDLLCVKAIQELHSTQTPFEVILCGVTASSSELATAFNEGLLGLLESPIEKKNLLRLLCRAENRLKERKCRKSLLSASSSHEQIPGVSPKQLVRDRMIAEALFSLFYREGPFIERSVRVLSVSSSNAQQQLLSSYLRKLDICVDTSDTIESAVELLRNNQYSAVVASNVLSDGNASALSHKIHSTLKSTIPRLIVWTASPEKVRELSDPALKIDDVVLKPGPDAGLESILISIVVGQYQTLAG